MLGRWGSQLPTSIPYPATVFPTRIGFEGWVCLLLSSWKPGVCVCVCVRERERERYSRFSGLGRGRRHRGFPGSSDGKESTCNAGDPSLIPG